MKDVKQVKKLKLKVYTFVTLVDLIVAISMYIIMPIAQNYPPFSENIDFQKQVEAVTHIQQYMFLFVIVALIHIISMRNLFKKICQFLNKKYTGQEFSYDELKEIRKQCMNIPYKFYIIQLATIIMLGMIANIIVITEWLTVLRFVLIIFVMTALISIVQFIFLQQILGKVLLETYDINKQYEKNIGYRIKFSTNLIIQIIPFLAVSVIIVSLIGYAKTTEEKGNAYAAYYNAYMENRDLSKVNMKDLKENLSSIPLENKEDYYFIIPPDRSQIYVSKENTKLTDFFLKYMDNFYETTEGRVYEFYGTEQQAYVKKIVDNNGDAWYVGFEYYTKDYNLMIYYILVMIGVLVIYTVLIRIWSKNISKNLVRISVSLKSILEEENSKDKILPIVSNDELGDLAYYYNKIQEKVRMQQDIIQKQGQLATLGELAGGMAHDINTPISAINTAVLMLEEQVKEPEQKELLASMKLCTEKIISIVNSMRNQIRNLGSSQKEWFEIGEIIEDCSVIVHNEIKNSGCKMNINVQEKIEVFGEKNKLGQVITNIVMNSIGAYTEKKIKGNIDILAKQEDNKCIIEIKDYAGGIPEHIQPYIFKNILTTKGTKGTGIGLYLAYSVIKGIFLGDIYFESKVGEGTTFFIVIPNKKEEN